MPDLAIASNFASKGSETMPADSGLMSRTQMARTSSAVTRSFFSMIAVIINF